MRNFISADRVYLACGSMDMRKSIDMISVRWFALISKIIVCTNQGGENERRDTENR